MMLITSVALLTNLATRFFQIALQIDRIHGFWNGIAPTASKRRRAFASLEDFVKRKTPPPDDPEAAHVVSP